MSPHRCKCVPYHDSTPLHKSHCLGGVPVTPVPSACIAAIRTWPRVREPAPRPARPPLHLCQRATSVECHFMTACRQCRGTRHRPPHHVRPRLVASCATLPARRDRGRLTITQWSTRDYWPEETTVASIKVRTSLVSGGSPFVKFCLVTRSVVRCSKVSPRDLGSYLMCSLQQGPVAQ
jgi:hypothetical protein